MEKSNKQIKVFIIFAIFVSAVLTIPQFFFTDTNIVAAIGWNTSFAVLFSFGLYLFSKSTVNSKILGLAALLVAVIMGGIKILNIENIYLLVLFFLIMNFRVIRDLVIQIRTKGNK